MSEAGNKIFEGCIKGKRHAQNMLYREYAPSMLGICLRYAKSKDEAEDMVQEGFIKIFTKIKDYRGDGAFGGWMRRIMVNTAISQYKKNLKHQYHSDIDDMDDTLQLADPSHFDLGEVSIAKDKLMDLIQGLPEGYKLVFNLYVFEQYAHKEIAESLGISINTSKSQLSKARRLLASRITQITGTTNIEIT